MRHAARASRCFHPPESCPASWSPRPCKPKALQACSFTASRGVRHFVDVGDEAQILGDREIFVEAEALRHIADATLDGVALRNHVVAEAGSASGVRLEKPAENSQEGRLAAAIRAKKAVDLPAAHLHGEPVDHDAPAEALRDALNVDRQFVPVGLASVELILPAPPDVRRPLPFLSRTSTGAPGCSSRASSGASEPSTRKTSFPRFSRL